MDRHVTHKDRNERSTGEMPSRADTLRPHEFYLIRYVPDPVRGEFVNIGVVLREASTPALVGPGRAIFALTNDWRRVIEIFPNSDLPLLQETGILLRTWLHNGGTLGQHDSMLFDEVREQLCLVLQMTDPQGCLTSDIELHLKLLMSMYVDNRLTETSLGLGEAVAASHYTDAWDGFVIDCGYSTDNVTRFFHAVSVEDDEESAFALARRAEALREGVLRVDRKPLDLNAVVDAPPEESSDEGGTALKRYRRAVEAMRAAGITVLTVDEIPEVERRAQRELGLTG